MTPTVELPATSVEKLTRAPRVASIDIFRGLTMTLMIFVNELAEVKGLPWWNYHAPAKVNVMTYVDMVFPAFLFILGMTIPIALEHRLRKNNSMPKLWDHIILRTIALIVLGLILANAEGGNCALMGIGRNLWAILALLGGVLFWNVYPSSKRYAILFRVLRFSRSGLNDCNVRHLPQNDIERRNRMDCHLLSGDPWPSRLHLPRRLLPLPHDTKMALGTLCMVPHPDGALYRLDWKMDSIPRQTSSVRLAVR
jgi:Domain of unknown function (DUF5009)